MCGRFFRAAGRCCVARWGSLAAGAMLLAGCTPQPTRVVSFHVGGTEAADWAERRSRVVAAIRANDPDLLGVQGLSAAQLDDLDAALPDYGYHAAGADDGGERGEFTPIFWRKNRFDLLDLGTLWLSDEPRRAGSVARGAVRPWVATWVRLRFRESMLNELVVVNTRIDAGPDAARREAAGLLRRLAESHSGEPLVFMGDFAAGAPGSPVDRSADAVWSILTRDAGNLAELRDSFLRTGAPPGESGTRHAYDGRRDGPRTSWILHSRRFEPFRVRVDDRTMEGRWPSDHFPVVAELLFMTATDIPGL